MLRWGKRLWIGDGWFFLFVCVLGKVISIKIIYLWKVFVLIGWYYGNILVIWGYDCLNL